VDLLAPVEATNAAEFGTSVTYDNSLFLEASLGVSEQSLGGDVDVQRSGTRLYGLRDGGRLLELGGIGFSGVEVLPFAPGTSEAGPPGVP
jgi:hypothetical protein